MAKIETHSLVSERCNKQARVLVPSSPHVNNNGVAAVGAAIIVVATSLGFLYSLSVYMVNNGKLPIYEHMLRKIIELKHKTNSLGVL